MLSYFITYYHPRTLSFMTIYANRPSESQLAAKSRQHQFSLWNAIVGIGCLSVLAGASPARSASILYEADYYGAKINTISSTGVVTPFVTGLSQQNPIGLAFDRNNTLFYASYIDNSIKKVSATGVVTQFASGLSGPYAIAFAPDGNLFVANADGNSISKVSPTGDVTPFVTTGLNRPVALAFDRDGTMYESDRLTQSPQPDKLHRLSPDLVVPTDCYSSQMATY
jgi:sugar lactone lactonase YvrE